MNFWAYWPIVTSYSSSDCFFSFYILLWPLSLIWLKIWTILKFYIYYVMRRTKFICLCNEYMCIYRVLSPKISKISKFWFTSRNWSCRSGIYYPRYEFILADRNLEYLFCIRPIIDRFKFITPSTVRIYFGKNTYDFRSVT